MDQVRKPVVIVGAGPIGLAMAVRLATNQIPFRILEKGVQVGNNVLEWGHVNLFSNWSESVDSVSIEFLNNQGVEFDLPDNCPSGKDLVDGYLSKIGDVFESQGNLLLSANVESVEYYDQRQHFQLTYSKNNQAHELKASMVIDASGTWGNFNRLVRNENLLSSLIQNEIPDLNFISSLNQESKVAVIGNGHSAMNSLILLSKHSDCQVKWLIRSKVPKFGLSKVGGQSDGLELRVKSLIEEGRIALVSSFTTKSIVKEERGLLLVSKEGKTLSKINFIISNIGSFPDYSSLKGIKLNLEEKYQASPILVPKINPELHSCGSLSYNLEDTLVTDLPYFVVGMKSFGKAANFLLSKGYDILDGLMHTIEQEVLNSSEV